MRNIRTFYPNARLIAYRFSDKHKGSRMIDWNNRRMDVIFFDDDTFLWEYYTRKDIVLGEE